MKRLANLLCIQVLTLFGGVIPLASGQQSLSSTKTWLGDTNFNNPHNWNMGRVPSAKDNAIFPRRLGFAVQLPTGDTVLKGLVLPFDGELLLPTTGNLYVASCQVDCTGGDLMFLKSKPPAWADPKSWDGHNAATPDLEAIPCPTDDVLFPNDASFSVEMPDTAPRVGSLRIAGRELEGRQFSEMVSTDEGQRQFFTAGGRDLPEVRVTGRGCSDVSGCECDNGPLKDAVCEVVKGRCPPANCVRPVTPSGNCCPICGAYLLFRYNKEFSLTTFRKLLNHEFDGKGIDYYASKKDGKIQVVLLEKGEYEEKVQTFAAELKEKILSTSHLGLDPYMEYIAGPLVAPTSFMRVFGVFFGFFVLALFTFVVIFYVNTNSCKLSPDRQRQYLFAVFENQLEEVELCKPDQQGSTPLSRRQAFDNPMYGSTAQEVQVDSVEDDDEDEEDSDAGQGSHVYAALESISLHSKADGVKDGHNGGTQRKEVSD